MKQKRAKYLVAQAPNYPLYLDILKSFKNGETYESIGKRHSLSRQRIQQLVQRIRSAGILLPVRRENFFDQLKVEAGKMGFEVKPR